MAEIGVSVICNAYNHEKYIRDALDGFVMQKTNFPFEVLIHDDASTDKTADIIREYEKKYPDIIKPIYQTENQYSKNPGAVSRIQLARVTGKYIAVCEGDDYWTDPLKLQKQYDAMERHPEVDICAHSAVEVEANTKRIIRDITPELSNTIIPVENVINFGGGFVATNSLMYRAVINGNLPKYRKIYNIDWMLQIHGALRGGMLYIADKMSVYRSFSDYSWSEKVKRNPEFRLGSYKLVVAALESLKAETNGIYDYIINDHIRRRQFEICLTEEQYEGLQQNYKELYDGLSFRHRAYITVAQYIPAVKRLRRMLINGGKRKI